MLKDLWAVREAVRERNPLVYNITNTVVTNFTANVLLAAGASPIMSEGAAEAEDLARICNVLVLNIGTLHTRQINYCLKAGEYANKFQKPVVLDPVGVGATAYRNITAGQIMQDVRVDLIRGNYGEIGFISGLAGQVKGVDSTGADIDLTAIKKMAGEYSTLVAATGAIDYLTDGQTVMTNGTGHMLLQMVTGTGCALTSLTGAFLAVAEDPRVGVLAALAFYGAAAQKAAESSKGPGSFVPKFLDALCTLSYKDFKKLAGDKVGLLQAEEPLPASDTADVE